MSQQRAKKNRAHTHTDTQQQTETESCCKGKTGIGPYSEGRPGLCGCVLSKEIESTFRRSLLSFADSIAASLLLTPISLFFSLLLLVLCFTVFPLGGYGACSRRFGRAGEDMHG